jgi:hypothetical protein
MVPVNIVALGIDLTGQVPGVQTDARSTSSIERKAKDFSVVKTRPPSKPLNQRLGPGEVVDGINSIFGQDESPFDGDRYSVAAAEAEGCDAALQIAALQFVQQCDQDAGAGCTDGVPQRYRAAINVYLFGVEF